MTLVLGIETSCDETSAAVLEGAGDAVRLRSLVILSQDVHRVFGGVVPEIASRAHLTSIVPVVGRALADAGVAARDLDAVAVTTRAWARRRAARGRELRQGLRLRARRARGRRAPHGGAPRSRLRIENDRAVPPFTALLVSGGHTMLLDVPAWGDYRLLGATRDDAAGEAFDKVGKLLGLPYPGGPHDRAARARR